MTAQIINSSPVLVPEITLDISDDDESWLEFKNDLPLPEITTYIFNHLNWKRSVYIGIHLTNNATIQDLNKNYRGKDSPTNVLSFPAIDCAHLDLIPESETIPLGDIFFAKETIVDEAKRDHKTFEHHFYHLYVHGVLHLLGYDHIQDVDATEMEALEISILNHFNIKNPYEVIEHV